MASKTKAQKLAEEVSARRQHLREEAAAAKRENIQVTKLLKVLEDCALGKVKLTPDRIKAIDMLLAKAMPDLSAVKLDIETDKVNFFINTTFTPPEKSSAA